MISMLRRYILTDKESTARLGYTALIDCTLHTLNRRRMKEQSTKTEMGLLTVREMYNIGPQLLL